MKFIFDIPLGKYVFLVERKIGLVISEPTLIPAAAVVGGQIDRRSRRVASAW